MLHQCVRNGCHFSQCSNNSCETCNCPILLAFSNMYFENVDKGKGSQSKSPNFSITFQNFKQPTGKVLQNADIKACLSDLCSKYVFVPTDKASNNIIIVCIRSRLKNWDWMIAPLQLETQATLHVVKCCLTMLSDDVVSSHDTFMKSLCILSCLMITRGYHTFIGPPSYINPL